MRSLVLVFLLSVGSVHAHAQARGGARGGRGAPPAPRAAAPFDMTGYWVSIVTEDWRWRMFPNKGDYGGVPLNAEGRKIADSWDPAKDVAAGEQCKAYGAPGIMRIPGRFHVTWQDDQALKIEADAGKQTRTLYFGAPQGDAARCIESRVGIPSAGPGTRARRRRSARRGIAEGDNNEFTAGISAAERRAIQCKREADRVL